MKVRRYASHCADLKTESWRDSAPAPGNQLKEAKSTFKYRFSDFQALASSTPPSWWLTLSSFDSAIALYCSVCCWVCVCVCVCVCVRFFGQLSSDCLPYLRQFCQGMSPLLPNIPLKLAFKIPPNLLNIFAE